MKTINIALIEDDIVVQESLSAFFETQSHVQLELISESVESFLELSHSLQTKIDILLLDINLNGMSGIEGIPFILDEHPHVDIIMLTTFEDNDSIFKALCAGSCSYLSKRSTLLKILEAVEVVADGGSYMSPAIARKIVNHYAPKTPRNKLLSNRQKQIISGIVDGKSYKMIAQDLFVSIDTVRSHIKNIYKILEINSKAELIRKSYDNEL